MVQFEYVSVIAWQETLIESVSVTGLEKESLTDCEKGCHADWSETGREEPVVGREGSFGRKES